MARAGSLTARAGSLTARAGSLNPPAALLKGPKNLREFSNTLLKWPGDLPDSLGQLPRPSLPSTGGRKERPVSTSWIPSNDEALDPFVNNFQTLIGASPTSYTLSAPDATAITAAYTSWHAAYLAAINPTTRTKATVATKNLQKTNVMNVVRSYAATIRASHAVSDALKIGLGIHVRDAAPTPVPPPSTAPMLSLLSQGIGTQVVHAADETTPSKRARPAGTIGLVLFRTIAAEAAPNPDGTQFVTLLMRPDFTAALDPADNGKTATYFARWSNSRGELGPWSEGLVARIAA